MSPVKKIAYICAPEQIENIEKALAGFELVNVSDSAADPKQLYLEACAEDAQMLLIFDCGLEDDFICDVAVARENLIKAAQGKTGITISLVGFVGDALRETHDKIFTDLFNLGVEYLVGPVEGKHTGYDMYAAAASLVKKPQDKFYENHVLGQKDFARAFEAKQEEEQQIKQVTRKQNVSALGERDLSTRFICVMQSVDRNGSTHLAIMLASAIRALNISVALVLNERHYNEIKSTYEGVLSQLPDSAYNLYGIGVYAGESPAIPSADKYAYVIYDAGTVSWFKTTNRTLAQRNEKMVFELCNVCIWSSFLTPTGQWSITTPDENGIVPLDDFVNASAFGKVRFAPFGMTKNQTRLAQERIAAATSMSPEEVKVVGIEAYPNPFLISYSKRRHIPHSIADLLSAGVLRKSTCKALEKYMAAQTEDESFEEITTEELPEEAKEKRSLMKRLFGSYGD